jgi:hypothetical protein
MATKYFARKPITHKGTHYKGGDEITGFTGWWRYWQFLRYGYVNKVDTASAPVITGITAGNGTLEVAFTAVEVGGDPFTDIEYSFDSVTWYSSGGTSSPFVIGDLNNGQMYDISIRAINASGAGAASDGVSATPVTVPAKPTSLIATPGNTQASIAFTAGDTGGTNITNYKYRIGSGAWTAFSPADPATPVVITGLTNGVQVSITLRAVNAVGDGAISDPVLVTPSA